MAKKIAVGLLSYILVVIAGCVNLKTKHLDPEYREPVSSTSVLIVPLYPQNDESSDRGSDEMMGPEERKEFNSIFGRLFSKYTLTETYGIDPDYTVRKDAYTWQFLKLGNSTLQVLLPDTTHILSYKDTKPDFVLFLQNHHFNIDQRTESLSTSGSFNARQGYALAFRGNYVIWDNRSQDPIGWGTIDQSVRFTSEATTENYITLLEIVAKEIIDNSPFPAR
ncbi:MAG: hypothetical protein R3211_00900 [Balneolaceae bacterium]|nr:hypothetical protein [Balneolaceae bacterium]